MRIRRRHIAQRHIARVCDRVGIGDRVARSSTRGHRCQLCHLQQRCACGGHGFRGLRRRCRRWHIGRGDSRVVHHLPCVDIRLCDRITGRADQRLPRCQPSRRNRGAGHRWYLVICHHRLRAQGRIARIHHPVSIGDNRPRRADHRQIRILGQRECALLHRPQHIQRACVRYRRTARHGGLGCHRNRIQHPAVRAGQTVNIGLRYGIGKGAACIFGQRCQPAHRTACRRGKRIGHGRGCQRHIARIAHPHAECQHITRPAERRGRTRIGLQHLGHLDRWCRCCQGMRC